MLDAWERGRPRGPLAQRLPPLRRQEVVRPLARPARLLARAEVAEPLEREQTGGRSALVEIVGRSGDMPPLHVHHHDDETFVVLDGTLRLFQPGAEVVVEAGSTFRAARGVPHV